MQSHDDNGGESQPQSALSARDCFDEHARPGSRFITKYQNYFEIYDRYFGDFRGLPVKMIEIGVQHGGSLQMWKRYFGPESLIVGLDIYPDCKKFEEDGIRIEIGDQSDPKFLARVLEEFGPVDCILDDGSHIPRHQIASFEFLFRHALKFGGVYIVEDTHTSYWKRYGGGYLSRGSFVEYAKGLADKVNFWHIDDRRVSSDWVNESLESVEFYSSVVAFRKRQMDKPEQVNVGDIKALDLEAPFMKGKLGAIAVLGKKSPALQSAVRRAPLLWDLMKRIMN